MTGQLGLFDVTGPSWPPPTAAGRELLAVGMRRVGPRDYADPVAATGGRRCEVTSTWTGRPPQRYVCAVFVAGMPTCSAMYSRWWRVEGGAWRRGSP